MHVVSKLAFIYVNWYIFRGFDLSANAASANMLFTLRQVSSIEQTLHFHIRFCAVREMGKLIYFTVGLIYLLVSFLLFVVCGCVARLARMRLMNRTPSIECVGVWVHLLLLRMLFEIDKV